MEALRRREERWQREDAAHRLLEDVPSLSSLSIEIQDRSGDPAQPPTNYVRRVHLPGAPAHFEIPCSDRKCENGGYDITSDILEGLRSGKPVFEGTVSCLGSLPEHACTRSLHWTVRATFADERADAA